MNSTNNLSLIHPDNFDINEDIDPPNSDYISSDIMDLSDEINFEVCEIERNNNDAYDFELEKNINKLYSYVPPLPKPHMDENDKFRDINFKIGNGKMDYIKKKYDKKMLTNAWKAITLTNTWKFVAENIEGFTVSDSPLINEITNKMEELGYTGHSGCSFGLTMRNMQYLAIYGEDKFKKIFNGPRDTEEDNSDRDTEIDTYYGEDDM